jgi:acyl-CoA thioesterase-1
MKRSMLLALTCLGLTSCATAPDDIDYLALGASDAAGVGAVPPTEGYVFLIEDELEDRVDDVHLVNLGIPSGDIAAIERALEGFLATGQEPDLVTLWVGPNDVIRGDDPEDFEGDLEDILEQLREETDAVIIMANIPQLTQLPRFREEPDPDVTEERVEAFNEAIERQAERFDVSIVDLREEDVEEDLVSDVDGFHPNNEGHRRIADEFLEVILPELGLGSIS